MNKLLAVIDKFEEQLKSVDVTKKEQLYKSLDIETMEKAAYLTLNAQMFASGKIDLDKSQFIYNKLKSYSKTSLAERIVITQVLAELAKMRIAN